MRNKKRKGLLIGILLLILLGWAPWLTKEYAGERARDTFTESQVGIIDGCGFNCSACGVISNIKIPFGYKIEIQFKCGMKNNFR
jgi:hypothetical protein